MKKWLRALRIGGATVAAVGLMGAVSACGGESEPTPVSVVDSCAPEHHGDQVIVKGFLRLPEKLELSDTAVIDLFSLMQGDGDSVAVRVPIGEGPSQLRDLPSEYSASSLRVGVENDDRTVSIIDRVVVTAKAEAEGDTCVLTDPVIERDTTGA